MLLISKLIGCLWLLLFSFPVFAQTPRVDSLKDLLSVARDSSTRLHLLLALCEQKESLPGDSILSYATHAGAIARALNDQPRQLLAEYYVLLSRGISGNIDSVLAEDNRILPTLTYARERDLFVKYSLQRARLYIKSARYKEAQATLYTLLTAAETAGDAVTSIYALTYIGWTHMEMEQLPTALEWFRKAEAELRRSKPNLDYSPLYSNTAAVLDDMGRHDSAWEYIQLAIKSSRERQDLSYLANGYAIQADILIHQHKTAEAEASLHQAIDIRRQIGDPFYVLSDMAALAWLYSTDNKPQEGIRLCQEGISLARQYHFLPKELYLSQVLAENYKAAKDYVHYSATLQDIITLKDSLYQRNSHETLAEMQAKYESEKKENTIIEQKYRLVRKNYFIYFLTGLLFFILILGVIFFEVFRHRQRVRMKVAELESNRTRMEAIDHAREEERKRILADLHDELGSGLSSIRIMSDLMANQAADHPLIDRYAQKISDISRDTALGMNTIIWALNNENDSIHDLCAYIGEFGRSLFEDSDIVWHLDLPDTLPPIQLSGASRKNIFLCVKESLHNILKHSHARKATVGITTYDGILQVTITDDGKGLSEKNKFGNGLKNISRRMTEIGGQAEFLSEQGLRVRLRVPLV